MIALLSRTSVVTGGLCLVAALGVAGVAVVGIGGVRATVHSESLIASDEMTTTIATAQFSHDVEDAYGLGLQLTLSRGQAVRSALAATLYDQDVPEVEESLAALVRLHHGDAAAEHQEITLLTSRWAALRSSLNDSRLVVGTRAEVATEMASRHRMVHDQVEVLIEQEAADARARETESSSTVRRTTWGALGASGGIILLMALLGVLGNRRLRREIEPAQDQAEFANTLQLAESEDEAHRLLQRRLQRVVPASSVTVLNRNNSADRLEAVTALPEGSLLAARLERAEPRACLAVRSAQPHDEGLQPGLLECAVCHDCPGFSTCTPLTVGGEVIGSVLINRGTGFAEGRRRLIRDAVSQAAPVLANLRNLAIAELRAATDSLTGLPNKRAVADTLKRLVAHATRTNTPLAMVVLDLDHFKAVNDRFGHQVGDQALASVGAALRATLRDSDFAGRNGGEEFAVLLPDTELAGALATAEKLRKAIADIVIPGLELTFTASFGVALCPDHAIGSERLERLADAALYVAKQSGRNRVEIAATTPAATPATAPGERLTSVRS